MCHHHISPSDSEQRKMHSDQPQHAADFTSFLCPIYLERELFIDLFSPAIGINNYNNKNNNSKSS